MALQQNYTFKDSVALTNAYFKVTKLIAIPNDDTPRTYEVSAIVSLFSDDTKIAVLDKFVEEFSGIAEADLTYTGVYTALKTLDNYSGAIDV